MKTYKPVYVHQTSDSVRIRHKELMASINGTTTFNVDGNLGNFSINPGIAQTFQWLSNQALNWEKYRFHALKFCYYTKAATTTVGSVMMAIDYDSADNPPLSETAMASFYGATEDAPWKTICQTVDMKRIKEPLYIRSNPTSGQDIKTLDVGNLYLATTDAASAGPWGKLWVEYDVELMIPQAAPIAQIGAYTSTTSTTSNLYPNLNLSQLQSRNYPLGVNGDPVTPNQLNITGLVVGKTYSIQVIYNFTTGTFTSIPTWSMTPAPTFQYAINGTAVSGTVATTNYIFLAVAARAVANCAVTAATGGPLAFTLCTISNIVTSLAAGILE